MNKLKIGLIQMKVSQNKKENLDKAYNLIKDLTCKRVDIVVLPEMFSTPYVTSNFPLYAEKEGDYSYNFLSNIAKSNFRGKPPTKSGKPYWISYFILCSLKYSEISRSPREFKQPQEIVPFIKLSF